MSQVQYPKLSKSAPETGMVMSNKKAEISTPCAMFVCVDKAKKINNQEHISPVLSQPKPLNGFQ